MGNVDPVLCYRFSRQIYFPRGDIELLCFQYETRNTVDGGIREYNEQRPHESLSNLTPEAFAHHNHTELSSLICTDERGLQENTVK